MYKFVIYIIVLIFFFIPGINHEGIITWIIQRGVEWRTERVEGRLERMLDYYQE